MRARMCGRDMRGARRGKWVAAVLSVFAVLALALAPVAAASSSFTWTGSESSEDWSVAGNWEGTVAPSSAQALATLDFPRLTSSTCQSESPADACYFSANDISGLSAESMQLDDSDDYVLAGEAMTLGGGGLTAAPGGASGGGGAFMFLPLQLSSPQRWSITEPSGGAIEENGLFLGETVTGAGMPLTIELDHGPALLLENDTEVGSLTIEGPNATGQHIDNGSVLMGNGKLNATDREPVELSRVYFEGTGALGPLTVNDATLVVGNEGKPDEGLEAASAKLDSNSGMLFSITGPGTTAKVDYSQLTSGGSVELAGAIAVVVDKPSKEAACPVLTPGEKFTFISTTGQLSGMFGNAPEDGPEIAIEFAKSCEQQSQTMRISYSRSNGAEAVIGTVDAQAKERQEQEVRETEAKEQEAKQKEAAATKSAEEHAQKLREEVASLEAADTQRRAEEAAKLKAESTVQGPTAQGPTAHGGVLADKEVSKPKPLTRAQLLALGLKQCRKQPKSKRAKCEAKVRRKYGSRAKGRKR